MKKFVNIGLLRFSHALVITIAVYVLLFASGIKTAKAEDDPAWTNAFSALERAREEDRCSDFWDILWPLAKQGNREARSSLIVLLIPFPHIDQIFAPGNEGDLISTLRDATIFGIHFAESLDGELLDIYSDTIFRLAQDMGFEHREEGKKYLACMKEKPFKNCANIAVNGGLIPSFESYAKQIDLFMVNGIKSSCDQHRGSR